jgi:hypothetical protein
MLIYKQTTNANTVADVLEHLVAVVHTDPHVYTCGLAPKALETRVLRLSLHMQFTPYA